MGLIVETEQERLLLFIKAKFKTKKAFADRCNMAPSNLTKYLRDGGAVFTSAKAQQILTDVGLDYHWYRTGEGHMLLEDEENKTIKVKLQHLNVPLGTTNLKSLSSILSDTEYSIDFPKKGIGVYVSNDDMHKSMPIGSYAIFDSEKDIIVNGVGLFKSEGAYFCRKIKSFDNKEIELRPDSADFSQWFKIEEIEFLGLLKMVIIQQ